MSSRDDILNAVKLNQPGLTQLPDIDQFKSNVSGSLEKFASVLTGIGGQVFYINNLEEIDTIITSKLNIRGRIINRVAGLNIPMQDDNFLNVAVHQMHNVELAVIQANFAVAENGAVWVTEERMGQRALPFICENLAVIINQDDIVPTMHEAYELVSLKPYDYGCFIAGPSKTADIEQSLVIGAHGPRSMTVFIRLV